MKFGNTGLIGTIVVDNPHDSGMGDVPHKYNKKAAEFPEKSWYDWPTSEAYGWSRFNSASPFELALLEYQLTPSDKPLNRQCAFRIIRNVGCFPTNNGLNAPTHIQIFQFAYQEIFLGELRKMLLENERGAAICPVSINLEYPFYYWFGFNELGGRHLRFEKRHYRTTKGQKSLEFGFDESRKHSKRPPLILAADNVTPVRKLMPVAKAIQLGAYVHTYEDCERAFFCPQCGHNQLIHAQEISTGYGSYQCVKCERVFHVELKQ